MTLSSIPPNSFQMVDVFAEEALLGNPLPVIVDSKGLSGEEMLRIARWMDHSIATFLLPPSDSDADYRVRIFTPQRELPFAGHATLGTCYVWLKHGGEPQNPELIVQQCGSGLIRIRREGKQLAFEAPPLQRSGPVENARIEEVASERAVPPYMAQQGTRLDRAGRIHVAQEGNQIWIGGA